MGQATQCVRCCRGYEDGSEVERAPLCPNSPGFPSAFASTAEALAPPLQQQGLGVIDEEPDDFDDGPGDGAGLGFGGRAHRPRGGAGRSPSGCSSGSPVAGSSPTGSRAEEPWQQGAVSLPSRAAVPSDATLGRADTAHVVAVEGASPAGWSEAETGQAEGDRTSTCSGSRTDGTDAAGAADCSPHRSALKESSNRPPKAFLEGGAQEFRIASDDEPADDPGEATPLEDRQVVRLEAFHSDSEDAGPEKEDLIAFSSHITKLDGLNAIAY
mmetsp:Transcript_77117/g.195774  ORF Transcript_77117/g.195774 Transcript_77117/m.195774 type:complete len:270 (+) Transcript_77117:52-861(+)|eukprot:CAMPEP_0183511504 /NCGR_PEP_ID=MMETSP0371-20130417/10942_1 /TAXON_ID=268820 /ORGANISM="Peridinium aciculiferum, Strain PAER-2" /LENGTH=269 /DNA_ID=CAMNT_0025708433 /DNA_START=48 /DNA_END=857 /DNA_ORIENTATION=+